MFQAEKQEKQKHNGGGGGMKRHQPAVLRLEPIRAELRARPVQRRQCLTTSLASGQAGDRLELSIHSH